MATSFDFKKCLGKGHFGEVWLALDTGLGCECALKCIPPGKVINQTNFFQEAQLLKAAEHSNIVSVNETGVLKDARVYVSMEYHPKGSLEDEASGAYVKLSRAKQMMVDILRALSHAHSLSIIHRDIKPANILIGNSNEGKLSDFGLALSDISSLDPTAIKGYQYVLHLAPEVNSFEDCSFLSDIYACGVTLYRLVNGDSYLPSILIPEARDRALRGKFPDRNRYRDFIPRPIRIIINRAMNIDPSQRYQSADEMRHDLEQVTVDLDWEEIPLVNGTRWTSSGNGTYYEVTRLRELNGTWAISTKKGKDPSSLRHVHRLCSSQLSKSKADQFGRKILQGHVNGKY